MASLPTNHSALTATIQTLILAIEAAAQNGSAFLPTAPASAHTTVQQPLQALDTKLQTLKTTLTTWRRKAEKMNSMHRELQHIANNSSLTHAERAVKITDVLDDIGCINDDYITSFRAFTSVLARLYTLLSLLSTNPSAAVVPRPASTTSHLLLNNPPPHPHQLTTPPMQKSMQPRRRQSGGWYGKCRRCM